MIREVAVENMTLIAAAIQVGAGRIELNDNLAVGGTTVSAGVMHAAVAVAHEHGVQVVAMIRPRGGDFVYTEAEIAVMVADLAVARDAGVDAVTFGALTRDGFLATTVMERLMAASGNLPVVMHMAFDAIPAHAQAAAIDWLVAHNVVRILTHGGPLTTPITETLPHLQEIVGWAHGRIGILPGGGVTMDNVAMVTSTLDVSEAHGTKIVGQLTTGV